MGDIIRHTCHSGGAKGADIAWGDAARRKGHVVKHWSFENHWTKAPRNELIELGHDLLALATPRLVIANRTLGRKVPRLGTPVGNLIHRNWYQVKDSGSVYAISTFIDGQVDGGTAWATQMFIDLHEGRPCEAYVFDQVTCQWHKWEGAWIEVDRVPPPSGEYAGVGKRDLLPTGFKAIGDVYEFPVIDIKTVPSKRSTPEADPIRLPPFRLPPFNFPSRKLPSP